MSESAVGEREAVSPPHEGADVLRSMYWTRQMSMSEIAEHFGVSQGTIAYWMRKHEIPTRSSQEASRVASERGEAPEPVGGSEGAGEPRESAADVFRRSEGETERGAPPSREREVSVNGQTIPRSALLDRTGFRELFYDRGLSPRRVAGVLELSPRHVGTLMQVHGVGRFGHGEVADERIRSLMVELSDEEWAAVVQ